MRVSQYRPAYIYLKLDHMDVHIAKHESNGKATESHAAIVHFTSDALLGCLTPEPSVRFFTGGCPYVTLRSICRGSMIGFCDIKKAGAFGLPSALNRCNFGP